MCNTVVGHILQIGREQNFLDKNLYFWNFNCIDILIFVRGITKDYLSS